MPAPPLRFELTLGEAYDGMVYAWNNGHYRHARQFARAILAHQETYRKTPRKWLANAVAVDRACDARSRSQDAAVAMVAGGEGEREMTPDQREKIRRLGGCTMLPGSAEKRFVRDMAGKPDDYELTHKQVNWLGNIWHRYRVQLAGGETISQSQARRQRQGKSQP